MSVDGAGGRRGLWVVVAIAMIGCAHGEGNDGDERASFAAAENPGDLPAAGSGGGGGAEAPAPPPAPGPASPLDAGTGADTTTDDVLGAPTDVGAAACVEAMESCTDTSQCCGGLLCDDTTLGQVCCGDVGASCSTVSGEDCCGALLCVDGSCQLPAKRIVEVDYQVQETGYWCGPASTRIALSAHIAAPSQQTLADELPATVNGTDWIGQVTAVMNDYLGADTYKTTEMPNDPPSQQQRDLLWTDVVHTIDAGYVIIANIAAPPSNHPPGYPNDRTIYHYLTIIGYDSQTREVYIADPASFQGNQLYWLSFDQTASLIATKGYSSLN